MANVTFQGPTSALPGRARRRGRSAYVTDSANNMLGEVTAVDWNTEIAQIDVLIPGTWRNEQIPGAETRTGTFSFNDVDDRFKLMVYAYIKARRMGDRTALIPEFTLIVNIDDTHSPSNTRWQLSGCQLYQYSGGYSNDDDLITRQIPFSYRDDFPLEAFAYTNGTAPNNIITTTTGDNIAPFPS